MAIFISTNPLLSALISGLILLCLTSLGTLVYKNWQTIKLFIRRKQLEYFPVRYNVASSLDFREGLNSGTYYREIKRKLTEAISSNHLNDVIQIHDFSDIKKFSSNNEAESFKIKKDLDLIIWGGFSEDGLKKDGELVNKLDLKFTYGHPDDKEKRLKNMIILDIGSKLATKNYWQILDLNSSLDTEIISNNIFDISLYILGLTLKLSGRIGKALKIFETLSLSLDTRKDDFSNQITPHILNCYTIFINDCTLGKNRKKFEIGRDYCVKYLKILPNDFYALSNLAALQCVLGEENQAEENIETLLKLYPKLSVTELDVAYFRILKKNYTNAYKHYDNLSKFKSVDFYPQQVVEFLYAQYESKKDPAFLYGVGIVSYYYGDRHLALQAFNEYLDLSNENVCKQMYRTAKRLVSGIQIGSNVSKPVSNLV